MTLGICTTLVSSEIISSTYLEVLVELLRVRTESSAVRLELVRRGGYGGYPGTGGCKRQGQIRSVWQ